MFKHKVKIILTSCAIVAAVGLLVGILMFQRFVDLGEYYCVFDEYDCDRSKEYAHEQLLANGYVMHQATSSEEDISGETLYYLLPPEGDNPLLVIDCDSVEIAKQVYADFFKSTREQSAHVWNESVFLGANSFCRINSCVYALTGGDTFSSDLFLAYDLDVPQVTSIHLCKKTTKAKDLCFEDITRIATECGYTCYYNSAPEAFFKQQVFIVSPQRDAAFSLVQTSDEMDAEARDTLKTLYLDISDIAKGNKLVLLPDDAAIVGNCDRLDEFLELIRNVKSKNRKQN